MLAFIIGLAVLLGGPREGDIVFQTSRSAAIQAATGSTMSHMGVLYRERDGWAVFEAAARVQLTPLREWVAQGERGRVVIKRFEGLAPASLTAMKELGRGWMGRRYDATFEWSDERMYCSELVYKLFDRGAKIELGALQRFAEFDLDHPVVRRPLRKRFGRRLPLDEPVVSPAAIYDDPRLKTVFDGVL